MLFLRSNFVAMKWPLMNHLPALEFSFRKSEIDGETDHGAGNVPFAHFPRLLLNMFFFARLYDVFDHHVSPQIAHSCNFSCNRFDIFSLGQVDSEQDREINFEEFEAGEKFVYDE